MHFADEMTRKWEPSLDRYRSLLISHRNSCNLTVCIATPAKANADSLDYSLKMKMSNFCYKYQDRSETRPCMGFIATLDCKIEPNLG